MKLPILEMEDVRYYVHDKPILDIPSFELYEGDFLGILGPNGAGKSTFLKLLAFLEGASSGFIFYRGEKRSANTIPLEERRRFAVAMQQSLLLQTTVFENVAIGLRWRKSPKVDISKKVTEMLELFKISHLAKKHAHQLSGGEAQRVNLARAFAVEPEILFLDEPFSALDFPTKMQLIEDLQQIVRTRKTTVVFISHDLLEIQALSTRLLILMDGKIEQLGTVDSVLQSSTPKTTEFLQPWKKYFFPILNAQ